MYKSENSSELSLINNIKNKAEKNSVLSKFRSSSEESESQKVLQKYNYRKIKFKKNWMKYCNTACFLTKKQRDKINIIFLNTKGILTLKNIKNVSDTVNIKTKLLLNYMCENEYYYLIDKNEKFAPEIINICKTRSILQEKWKEYEQKDIAFQCFIAKMYELE